MGETNQSAPAPAELYPGHAAELQRHAARIAAIGTAATRPLPGPLAEVYGHVPETIAGFTVRPLVHYDFVVLQQLDSPLLRHLQAGASGPTPFEDDESYAMVWQFTRPVRVVAAELAAYTRLARKELADATPEAIRQAVRLRFIERAREEIGYALDPVAGGQLIRAVEREFLRAFSTVISYEPRPAEDGQSFTVPPVPTTGSAGGSNTLAV